MERLTGRRDGRAYIVGCPDFALPKIAGLIIQQTVDRLATIEDILGDGYDLDRLRELAQADREGRIVLRSAGAGKKCGSCGHFRRIPGSKRGTCAIRRWERNRMGQTEPWRHSFTPSQSYGACREYVRGESSATE